MTCKARQYGDQMICGKCGLQWDVNDPDAPECNGGRVVRVESRQCGKRARLAKIKELLK